MKVKEIAKKHNLDVDSFENWAMYYAHGIKINSITSNVNDADVDKLVSLYLAFKEKQAKEEEEKKQRELERMTPEERAALEEETRRKEAIAGMLISSGFSFDGYKIVKYSGYISGDDATEINSLGFKNSELVTNALVKIRTQALKELKEAAYDLGCNAVIGVDFDYLTLEPSGTSVAGLKIDTFLVCVTANGNAVIVEKE